MQDAELLLPLAEIAGVFVGFGALIAVRSGGASGPLEIGYTRGMVGFGSLTVVAALAPITLARYDLTDHQVWMWSSILVVAGYLIFLVANARTPEYRTNWAMRRSGRFGLGADLIEAAISVAYVIFQTLALIVVILGQAPDLDAALYSSVVVLTLMGAGWLLLALVFAARGPAIE